MNSHLVEMRVAPDVSYYNYRDNSDWYGTVAVAWKFSITDVSNTKMFSYSRCIARQKSVA